MEMTKIIKKGLTDLIKVGFCLGLKLEYIEAYHTEFFDVHGVDCFNNYTEYSLVLCGVCEEPLILWSGRTDKIGCEPDLDKIHARMRLYSK